MLKARNLLIGPYPPGSGKQRRFLILSDEIAEVEPTVVWVYLSTSMSDPTVVLAAGCHPDVTQNCRVIYEEAEIVRVSAIRAAIEARALTQSSTSLPADLTVLVQEGVFTSEDTPLRVVRFCTERT